MSTSLYQTLPLVDGFNTPIKRFANRRSPLLMDFYHVSSPSSIVLESIFLSPLGEVQYVKHWVLKDSYLTLFSLVTCSVLQSNPNMYQTLYVIL